MQARSRRTKGAKEEIDRSFRGNRFGSLHMRTVVMEFPEITKVLGLLQEADIVVCIVGEFALNYYNAPRVVHVSAPNTVFPTPCLT